MPGLLGKMLSHMRQNTGVKALFNFFFPGIKKSELHGDGPTYFDI